MTATLHLDLHRLMAFQRMPMSMLCNTIVGDKSDDLSLEVVANICIKVQDVYRRAEIFWKMEANGLRENFVSFAFSKIASSDYDLFISMILENEITYVSMLDALKVHSIG